MTILRWYLADQNMYKNYFGKERQGILDWLICDWLPNGPTTCFVVGFPGVGKSDVAAAVTEHAERQLHWPTVYIEIPDQENPSFGDVMLDLADQLASIGHTEMQTVLAHSNPNPAYALEKGLQKDVLVVIDEFGRLFDQGGRLAHDVAAILSHLRNRPALRGRLLFLSDVAIESERWSEAFPTKELHALDPSEAIALLNDRLIEQGKVDEVPEARKSDLVRILGFNPRGIETLSAALAFESLDEIVGRDPGLWQVNDREFSAGFLERLERRLLEGTLAHLDPLQLMRLTMLAVYRKSFKASAFEALTSGARKEWRDLRHALVSRFLVQLRNQWHSMNPVVREISLARLRENVSEFKKGHSLAADHHLRHFRARNLALDHNRLTGSYAELRYHLFHAGRTSELREVALRLSDHFKESWKATSPVPQDRAELDERIGVLAALLQDEGPKSLEYYLARCLQTRGTASDIQEALTHVTRATDGKAPAATWLLRANLHKDIGDRDAAVQAVLDAVRVVHPSDAIGTLYVFGGQILAEQGRIDDALLLMREGILKVPPSKNLFMLYQAAAELLGRAGKTDDAVALLKEGIKVIPADKSLSSLYQSAAELLGEAGKSDDAMALLKEGMKVIPADKNLFTLYQSAAELLGQAGKSDDAVALLKEGIKVIPADKNLFTLYQSAAELLGQAGKSDDAVALLKEGMKVIPADKSLSSLYQSAAELLGQAGKSDDAMALLKEGMKVIPANQNLFMLYQSSAELLAKAGDVEAAEEYLKAGIRSATRSGGLVFHLYQRGAEFLNRHGRKQAAIDLLLDCIREIPGTRNSLSVFKTAAELLAEQEQYDDALAIVDKGRNAIASGLRQLDVFYRVKTRILMRAGRFKEARECIEEGMAELRSDERGFLSRLADELAEEEQLRMQAAWIGDNGSGASHENRLTTTESGNSNSLPGNGKVVHISYAWGGESEDVADTLERKLLARGHCVKRDKSSMRTGDWISRFIAEIGQAGKVVVVFSAKYVRSPYCMRELLYLWQSSLGNRGDMFERIAPVVLSDACLDQAIDRLKVVRYWKEERQRLEEATEGLDPLSWGDSTREQLLLIRDFEHRSADMLSWAADILIPRGTSAVKERFNDFLELIETVDV